jgi:hypothetical protein
VKKLTEVKKITKIALLAYGIVNIIYGPMGLLFPSPLFVPPTTNPFNVRFQAATLLGIAIFCFLILIKKDREWESIKLLYGYLYYLLVAMMILEPTRLLFGTPTEMMISQTIMDMIIMSVLLVLGVYAYIKQQG